VIDSTCQGAGFDDELAEALCVCNHANCDDLSAGDPERDNRNENFVGDLQQSARASVASSTRLI
jgi:hypothetical protein